MDPAEIDALLGIFAAEPSLEYLSNQAGAVRRIPHGLDVEVFSFAALERAHREATSGEGREHVTPYLYRSPGRFQTRVRHWPGRDLSHLRLTVDTPADLALVRAVFDLLGSEAETDAVADLLDSRPDLRDLNAEVTQKRLASHGDLRRSRLAGRRLLGRADAGPTRGYGHVARVSTLLLRWVASGGEATLCGHGIDGVFLDRLRSGGVELAPFPVAAETHLGADRERTAALAAELDAAAIAIDGYGFPAATHAALRRAYPLLAIDDLANFPTEADLVLNQNLDTPAERYTVGPHTRLLLGSHYVLLRPEFGPGDTPAEARRRVVVTFGASDPASVTPRAVEGLLPVLPEGYEIHALLGPGVSDETRTAVHALGQGGGGAVVIHENIADVAALFAQACLAVTAAGSSSWELLACGVPLLMVSVAENQRPIAAAIANRGAGIDLGWHQEVSADKMGAAWAELLARGGLPALAHQACALVDGRGTERVIDALLDVIEAR
jgi:spore coat polysaccharide biosynthesis predicted glycosyltransferase SpsG